MALASRAFLQLVSATDGSKSYLLIDLLQEDYELENRKHAEKIK